MFSRIYLGVHSPADILTGGMLGCLLLAVWLRCHEAVEEYLSNAPSLLSLLGLMCIVILLLGLHPDPYPVTIIFAETVCMTGVAMGFVIGYVLTPPPLWGRGLLEEKHLYSSVLTIVTCASVRYVIGLGLLVVVKMLAEQVVRTALKQVCCIAGVPTVCIKRKSEVSSERVHFSQHFIVLDEQVSYDNVH